MRIQLKAKAAKLVDSMTQLMVLARGRDLNENSVAINGLSDGSVSEIPTTRQMSTYCLNFVCGENETYFKNGHNLVPFLMQF
jgi:hypothetical protein